MYTYPDSGPICRLFFICFKEIDWPVDRLSGISSGMVDSFPVQCDLRNRLFDACVQSIARVGGQTFRFGMVMRFFPSALLVSACAGRADFVVNPSTHAAYHSGGIQLALGGSGQGLSH